MSTFNISGLYCYTRDAGFLSHVDAVFTHNSHSRMNHRYPSVLTLRNVFNQVYLFNTF